MRIQHNIPAMSSYRNYTNNTSAVAKNLEKLSSGYKINRAGDDAAGLAISEKMRIQITGLEQAQTNAKAGINLIQTAEGALTEVHSMLNRMYTLAEQSANGTYSNEVDREQLQKEIVSLRDEINRIADSTNYNGIKLLDGSLAETETVPETAVATQTVTIKDAGDGEQKVLATGTNLEYVEAVGEKVALKANDIKGDHEKIEGWVFEFTDAEGKSWTLNLAEFKADGTSDDGTAAKALPNLAKGLMGDTSIFSMTTSGEGQDGAWDAFQKTFKVKNNGSTSLDIEVRDPAGEGKLNSVKVSNDQTTQQTAITTAQGGTNLVDRSAGGSNNVTAATPKGLQITLNATAATNGRALTIGNRTYEYVADAATEPSITGAKAVVAEKTEAGHTHDNLVAALKEDGFDVTISGDKLIISNLDALQEEQAGAQVSTTSDKLVITDQESVKQTSTVTIDGASTAKQKYDLTIKYIDADGVSQSKVIKYTGDQDQTKDTNAIYNVLSDDKELSSLFEFKLGTNKIEVTSRSTDASKAQISNISSEDSTKLSTEVGTSKDDGKVISLKYTGKNLEAGDTVTVNGKTYEFTKNTTDAISGGNTRVILDTSSTGTMKNLHDALAADGIQHSFDESTGKITLADKNNAPAAAEAVKGGGLRMQIGDTAEDFNQLTVSVNDCHTKAMKYTAKEGATEFEKAADGMTLADIDISTQEGGAKAMAVIKNATNYVSDVRGTLGALQNRLDHTINNLSVAQQNIQDAESTIRDTDVAKEMMEYTKNSILVQSAQAMLAQANQLPQGVLQLLG